METVPQVPQIPVTQNSPSASAGLDQISAALDQSLKLASAPLPPQYSTQAQIAEPRLPRENNFVPINNNTRPVNNQSGEIQRARTKNNIASIFNLVGKAGQEIQDKKMQGLKADLKEVMTAKQNIANAQQVLQQDPNNAAAKQVLDSNKKSLEAILTDPKKQKQLTKALDISFIDPDKNKTPEVQAYQQAQKEVKEAGAFTSDNPAEHAVAQAAANGGKTAPTQQQAPQQSQATAPPKSQTPYADAAIAKDLPGLAVNPQYAAAVKQQQDAQKQINQYIIPKMIQAEQAKQLEAMKQGGANERANLKASMDYGKEAHDNITKLQVADTQAKARIQAQAMRDRTALAQTSMRVSAMLKVADDKRLDTSQKDGLKGQVKDLIGQQLKTALTEQKSYETQRLSIQADPSLTSDQKKEKTAVIEALQKNNEAKLKSLNNMAQDSGVMPKQETKDSGDINEQLIKFFFGEQSYKAPESKEDSDGRNKSVSSSESDEYKQLVGSDESDEPGVSGDEDDDSDNY